MEIDDAFVASVGFANGAIGTLEATRFAAGRKNHEIVEVNGEFGSIEFDLERPTSSTSIGWIPNPRQHRGLPTSR